MCYRLFLTSLFLLSIGTNSSGQDKYEREYDLDTNKIPKTALSFVGFDPFDSRVKWYFEENLQGNSIEAKFRFKDQNYSVEFDTLGYIQDIEVELRTGDLPGDVWVKIQSHLDSTYSQSGIDKIQIQYSGKLVSMHEFLKTENPENLFFTKYELVVKGKRDGHWNLYELLFDIQGLFLQSAQIILRNTDNLEY